MSPTGRLYSTLSRLLVSEARHTFLRVPVLVKPHRSNFHLPALSRGNNVNCLFGHQVLDRTKKYRASSTVSAETQSEKFNDEIFQVMQNFGFSGEDIKDISNKLQPLNLDKNKLITTLSNWGACQFGHVRLVYLLTQNPELLLVDKMHIMSSYTFISTIFSQNYVYRIFLNCPQIIYQKESEVSSKLNFLNKKLGAPNSQIVNSSCLAHSLHHLSVRYEFLKRCGIYKTPVAGTDNTNPSLSEIFDTPDEQFAKNVARLSPFEYEVFTQLFALEVNEDNDSDSE